MAEGAGDAVLRLVHEGLYSLRLEWGAGRRLWFDPRDPPEGGPAVLTWNTHEHLDGVERAVRAGRRPEVVAAPKLLEWLRARGAVDGRPSPAEAGGARVELFPYRPIPYASGWEIPRKAWSALRRPDRAARRLLRRGRLPASAPVAADVEVAGTRVLHLAFSLHRRTPADWLADVRGRVEAADLVVVGVDHDEEDALVEHVVELAPRRLVVADLLREIRERRLGLPARPVAPVADRLRARGVDAHVLAPGASLRFEALAGG